MTRILGFVPVLLSACTLAGDPSGSVDQQTTGHASVSLASSDAAITQTSDTLWSLAKTGAVDTSSKTVTWTITATKGSTLANQLVVSGVVAVTNSGSVGATIGNIVVNLQTRSGNTWTSASVDVADATSDDAATTAHIDAKASSENKSTFTENAASGHLLFEDASTNTIFALVPEVTIAPGATQKLLFSATFDNNVLKLAPGRAVRAEVIVSFGNAGPQPPSAANVDINGNGSIDADEHYVRSIPARLGLTVPAPVADNATVTIQDGASNIVATGTVTFSGTSVSLGATSGTVSVHYDGGTSGGTITNCATLSGSGTSVTIGGFTFPIVSGVSAQACDTESIGATTCVPGTTGCGWTNGDMLTYTQTDWGGGSTDAAKLLSDEFNTVYASTFGVLVVGLASPGFSMSFTDSASVIAYLPASGPLAPLDANLSDPTTTSSGELGGDVVALALNVDFSDAAFLHGTASVQLGNLTLCGFTTLPALNGTTVRTLLADMNSLLGAGSAPYSIAQLDPVAVAISNAFLGGTPSTFAQAQLVNGACP